MLLVQYHNLRTSGIEESGQEDDLDLECLIQ